MASAQSADAPRRSREKVACDHCGLPAPRPTLASDAHAFCCYGCRVAFHLTEAASGPEGRDNPAHRAASGLLIRLALGGFLAFNIMVFNWLFTWRHVFEAGAADRAAEQMQGLSELASYLLMLLGAGVIALLGAPLAADAIDASRAARQVDSTLLIVIGVAAAYGLSVVNTLRGSPDLYYDTAAILLVLVTAGRWLDARARAQATRGARSLLEALPAEARVEREGQVVAVPAAEVQPGDRLHVRPGEVVAVDGRVVEGRAHLDQATMTGESQPRVAQARDDVLAGCVVVDGPLILTVERAGGNVVLAQMQRMLEEARRRQPPIQLVADRISRVFVPGVVVLAILVFVWRAWWLGDPVDGLLTSLSVLLISCPCALGLAAPLTCWHALTAAARHGVLIDSGETIERAANAREIFFDKTGTLTTAAMRVRTVTPLREGLTVGDALGVAAALAITSRHPVSRAIAAAAAEQGAPRLTAVDVRDLPGLGVAGKIDGNASQLGGERLVEDAGFTVPVITPAGDDVRSPASDPALDAGLSVGPSARGRQDARPTGRQTDEAMPSTEVTPLSDDTLDEGASAVFLLDEDGVAARFDLSETLRPDAKSALRSLRAMGVKASMLTGDRPAAADRVAAELGMPHHAGLLPGDKVAKLREARAASRRPIVMVGDGLNDAPVLAAADVGVAMGSASELTRQAGRIHLTTDHLADVPATLRLARQTMSRIRWNLAWAFSYNTIGIAIAAAGLLTPVIAALAMLGSSLTIVISSTRSIEWTR